MDEDRMAAQELAADRFAISILTQSFDVDPNRLLRAFENLRFSTDSRLPSRAQRRLAAASAWEEIYNGPAVEYAANETVFGEGRLAYAIAESFSMMTDLSSDPSTSPITVAPALSTMLNPCRTTPNPVSPGILATTVCIARFLRRSQADLFARRLHEHALALETADVEIVPDDVLTDVEGDPEQLLFGRGRHPSVGKLSCTAGTTGDPSRHACLHTQVFHSSTGESGDHGGHEYRTGIAFLAIPADVLAPFFPPQSERERASHWQRLVRNIAAHSNLQQEGSFAAQLSELSTPVLGRGNCQVSLGPPVSLDCTIGFATQLSMRHWIDMTRRSLETRRANDGPELEFSGGYMARQDPADNPPEPRNPDSQEERSRYLRLGLYRYEYGVFLCARPDEENRRLCVSIEGETEGINESRSQSMVDLFIGVVSDAFYRRQVSDYTE
ncbi:MAG: hypothetical protein AAF447_06650 [Myxococcota bacterium]